jgi:LexA DNA binding domain
LRFACRKRSSARVRRRSRGIDATAGKADSHEPSATPLDYCFIVKEPYTHKQGQYLAFIHCYRKVNGRAPSEADMQEYFRVTPPSVHQMVVTLEAKGLIARVPGQGRSIRLLVPPEKLPALE